MLRSVHNTGWLYWRRGLEAAMLAHGIASFVLHVAAPGGLRVRELRALWLRWPSSPRARRLSFTLSPDGNKRGEG
jgi:hypothetical protein